MRCHFPHKRPAFTLVELLVVISIVVLLVALLLPALRGARDAARVAVCLSGGRQAGVAITQYLHDFNGVYFPGRWRYSGAGWWQWATGEKPNCLEVFAAMQYLTAYSKDMCPVEDGLVPYAGNGQIIRGDAIYYIGSASSDPDYAKVNLDSLVNERDIVQPPYKALLLEPNESNNGGDSIRHNRAVELNRERHNDRQNVLFADMHAESMPLAELYHPWGDAPETFAGSYSSRLTTWRVFPHSRHGDLTH